MFMRMHWLEKIDVMHGFVTELLKLGGEIKSDS